MGIEFTSSGVPRGQDMYGIGINGCETIPRHSATGTAGIGSSGDLRLTYFTAQSGVTVTKAVASTTGTAAGATPTLVRIGLWTVDANGGLTALVASTANDTSLFAATSTVYEKALSDAYTPIVGQRYAAGVLVVTGAARPTLNGIGPTGPGAAIWAYSPRFTGNVSGQADLPATVASGSIATSGGAYWIAFIP